jgi:hypothetical protein
VSKVSKIKIVPSRLPVHIEELGLRSERLMHAKVILISIFIDVKLAKKCVEHHE